MLLLLRTWWWWVLLDWAGFLHDGCRSWGGGGCPPLDPLLLLGLRVVGQPLDLETLGHVEHGHQLRLLHLDLALVHVLQQQLQVRCPDVFEEDNVFVGTQPPEEAL